MFSMAKYKRYSKKIYIPSNHAGKNLRDCHVEDEIQFICLCPNLNNIRSYYFSELNIDVGEKYMEQFLLKLCVKI